MKILTKRSYQDFRTYTLLSNGTNYQVNCLDGLYLCDCAIINNRNIKKDCKHIKYIKEND